MKREKKKCALKARRPGLYFSGVRKTRDCKSVLSRTGEPGEVKFASVFFLCKVRHADSHPLSALPISLDFSFFFLSCPRLSSVNTHARLLPITAPVHIVCNVCRQLFFFCLFLFFFFFVVVVVVSITARYKSSARSSLPYFFLNFSESKCVDTYR